MKTISIVVPTYNEQDNIDLIYQRIVCIFTENLNQYNYEILFIDNASQDATRTEIRTLCGQDSHVKAIFNARNFGFVRSTYYGLTQATGNCAILIFADMQDPPALIVDFVFEWEKGYKIVAGIKSTSKENRMFYLVRSLYYKFVKIMSDVEQIEHFTGFGLYDRDFIHVLSSLEDPMPYLRGIVAELGYKRKDITYEQVKRKHGKSSFNFMKLYDVAMLGITSYTKVLMRIATILGATTMVVSIAVAVLTLIIKLINWDTYPIGSAAIIVGVFFLGAVQLFFIGVLGEYVLNINTRVMKRPLVIEEERINFRKDLEEVH